MAFVPPPRSSGISNSAATDGGRKHGAATDKQVPESRQMRESIRAAAAARAARIDKSRPLGRADMQAQALRLLDELGLPAGYAGWTMVALASAFWREQVAAVAPSRRLLLLPHCLRSAAACPADYDAWGLACRNCGGCSLGELQAEAQSRGMQVLVAEGSPAVMKTILAGGADALLGVACLDVLEKTFDKILLAGIPAMAVPLVRDGCRDTATDEDWVRELIRLPRRPASVQTRTYLHLMRLAARMFEPDELHRLAPPRALGAPPRGEGVDLDAIEPPARTEAIAYDFLAAGGKHSRPFITLAAYDALKGGDCTLADGAARADALPEAVRCVALAIEVFHKASLVHDDLEDDDPLRYGQPALHRRYGVPAAVNVGDFLIGLGYRLAAQQRSRLGAETTAEIVACFAQAHTRLCEGQGAELLWRRAVDKRIAPIEALRIYALKTAPAFEAALWAGLALAGGGEAYREPAARFARHLGVAYQIINDLDDWEPGQPNERQPGAEVLRGRPTILWALALAGSNEDDRRELESLLAQPPHEQTVIRAHEIYQRADVFRQAAALVEKHHRRACQLADQLQHEPLRRLLDFLADAIIDRRPLAVSEE